MTGFGFKLEQKYFLIFCVLSKALPQLRIFYSVLLVMVLNMSWEGCRQHAREPSCLEEQRNPKEYFVFTDALPVENRTNERQSRTSYHETAKLGDRGSIPD
jgi:hypothetical protein